MPAAIKAGVAGHEKWRTVFGLLEQSQDGQRKSWLALNPFSAVVAMPMWSCPSPQYNSHYPTMRSSQNAIAAIATAIGKVSSSFALQ